ncbi:SO2930 family diheme c-type cytochrome [Ferrimonas marina]|uniref:Cytochrome c domain-containing protein n=1 Tax=Ferrimonas marina TaxID=299255 RepID=A0A1M5ZBH3_9GAMM|nr:SO2930 family diheme c-type cytochrome [Ferrimonas marina]SHI21584.1 conserved hypothetical protein, HNE_0200 family [Ferrimonas marina]
MRYLPLMALLLAACGGGGGDEPSPPVTPTPSDPPPTATEPEQPLSACASTTSEVNWEALMNEDCERLSQYGLFIDPTNPTQDPRTPGQHYLLTTELFSDYASKYRFLYLPEGEQMSYQPESVLTMPVGTVLVKSFALPFDTAQRGAGNETLIETRLLIHREAGWVALPYVWQSEGEAELSLPGALVAHQLTHQDQTLTFTYSVPSQAECKTCHQITQGDTVRFQPIGIKARLLNRPGPNSDNQLEDWLAKGWLDQAPPREQIPTAPALEDSSASLTDRAKGYLDINCAHCHRADGFASISGLRLGYFVNHTTMEYGICKQPPGYDGGAAGLDYDIVPGNGEASILPYRMAQLDAKDRMPPIGRALIHDRAVELVMEWIDAMPPELGACQ